ncbi:MucBP domain-containing protein [Listeria ivanovii]|uniref:Putative peptidoglycan linked protein (LPXTG motif) n=2 Tax=Listeria ivanovii TaxID=1638 RepID=G2ZD02_LISIP|nr:MucBP domain-containing protein [Listeria ivanovii]AHI55257.1 cell wall surface anchor protein [Listeria ivanovii WSLC3009]AIS64711.1 cell surface protein [Listeria ivanovii subsp. ivanovii]MBC1758593.1 cell surface protein [Listeria ivanovii]PZG54860.1 cell surface protein [Listeria ivanovii]QDA72750.1 cell surface protein [Listeria ivanovii]
MKKLFHLTLIVAICLSFYPQTTMALDDNSAAVTQENSEIVMIADLGEQAWLINEVNRQLSPKKVGVNLTFEDLAKITSIYLADRNLTGEVPPEINNLVSLESLVLYSNNLTGTIPAELGELEKLKALRLDYNQLSGTIPNGLGNIDSIMLQSNRLVGQLPLSLYENRTGKNEVNVSGNQITINSTDSVPSVYSAYTFTYPIPYSPCSGQIEAGNTFIPGLDNSTIFTPFLKGSPTYIDLKAKYMFDAELFAGHHITITDENTEKVIYDGELTADVSIPLSGWKPGSYMLNFVLDKAFNNPQNKTVIAIDILSPQAENVTIQYIDENGATIHDPQQISGTVDDYYNARTPEYQLTIPNYVLDQSKFPSNSIGLLSAEPQTVTYVYNKIDGAPVTVEYLDENGAEIAKSDVLTGKIDASYETIPKEISNWVVDENKLPINATGNFTEDSQTVIYTYKTNQTKITAHDSTIYVGADWKAKDNFDSAFDKNGNEVPFDEVIVVGTVDTSKPGIYSVKYIYAGAEMEIKVTVKAKEIPVNPTNPIALTNSVNPTSLSQPFNPNQPFEFIKVTSVHSEQSTASVQSKLPKTGDNMLDRVLYCIAGLSAIFAAISIFRKKVHS